MELKFSRLFVVCKDTKTSNSDFNTSIPGPKKKKKTLLKHYKVLLTYEIKYIHMFERGANKYVWLACQKYIILMKFT